MSALVWGVDLGVRSFHAVGIDVEEPDSESVTCHLELGKGGTRYSELIAIKWHFDGYVAQHDTVFVEEPPSVRNRRTACVLNQTAGAILSATSAQGYFVPVSSWKKAVCDKGSASKDDVAEWLINHEPALYALCGGNQNLVDAACIALYGLKVIQTVSGVSRISAGDLDISV